MSELFSEPDIEVIARHIDEWLAMYRLRHEVVVDAGRDPEAPRRWFVRMHGEEKEFTTIWLTLGQRTLRYETYVMPAPEENAAQLYEQALLRNAKLTGTHFSIGVENALFLRGELPLTVLSENEIDRIIGTLFAAVETHFPVLIRIGFASRFAE
jgi:hypothetical protein